MSARVSPSKELVRTPKVQKALRQLDAASGIDQKRRTQTTTHRSRIYQISSKAIREGRSVYTIVRDTVERPLKNEDLPQGQLYFATTGASRDAVGKEIERFCEGLEQALITDWNAAGSI